MNKHEIEELLQTAKDFEVLIVDDDEVLLNNYRVMAEKFFRKVTTATDGGEALQLHEVGKFDIIYTDINMPTMNGVELIRQILVYDPKQQFIVISASDDSGYLLELLQLHINAFVLKPFQLEDFIQTTRDKLSIIIQNRLMQRRTQELEDQLQVVTQEKNEQENMLIQQSKLAQTGEMISMIAHQWRQPLSTISSVIATFKSKIELDLYGENSKDQIVTDLDEVFTKIEESATFLSNTINDFRNYYRPDKSPKEFDLIHAVDVIVNMAVATNSHISLQKDYFAKEALIITFEGELQQVIMNILNNAKDILREKAIALPAIHIKIAKQDEDYMISITDNAGGIPEDIVDHIFLPYFSTKDQKNGTGIGLHMAQTIITNHMKGTIAAHNDMIIGGASFTIKIPTKLDEAI